MQILPGRRRPPLEHDFPATRAQKWLEGLALLLFVGVSATIFLNFGRLPERIAMHVDFKGSPDRYGSKVELLLLWAGFTALYGVFWALSWRLWRSWPYLKGFDESTLERHPEHVLQTLRTFMLAIKLGICALMGVVTFQILSRAGGDTSPSSAGLGLGLAVLLVLVLPAVIGIFMFKANTPPSSNK